MIYPFLLKDGHSGQFRVFNKTIILTDSDAVFRSLAVVVTRTAGAQLQSSRIGIYLTCIASSTTVRPLFLMGNLALLLHNRVYLPQK